MTKFVAGTKPHNFIDRTGQRLGKLFVVGQATPGNSGQVKWLCRCDCGKELAIASGNLRVRQRSCGCDRSTTATHSMTSSKEYSAWSGMIQRCTNPRIASFQHYGGRGISVSPTWLHSFPAFLADVGIAPSRQHSIDRIDVNGNYEPGNVRWATAKEQAQNRRDSIYVGEDHLSDACIKLGFKEPTLRYRVQHGVPLDKPLGRSVPIEANGLSMSITEWSKHLGIKKTTLCMRLHAYGWSPDKTFRGAVHG